LFLLGLSVVGVFLILVPNPSAVPEKNASLNASRRIGAFERDGARGVPAKVQLASNYGRLPLSFEANQGQTDPRVKFLSRGRGYALFLTGDEAVLALRSASRKSKVESRKAEVAQRLPQSGIAAFPGLLEPPALFNLQSSIANHQSAIESLAPAPQPPAPEVVRLKLVGASPKAKVVGLAELPGKSNYFIGNDPKKWRTNVPNYAKVKYEDVYAGVDLVYYGNQQQLEYDFVVAPGGDPRAIRFEIVGAVAPVSSPATGDGDIAATKPHGPDTAPLQIAANGDLVIATDTGEVRFHKPVVYQVAPPFRMAPAGLKPGATAAANPKSQIQNRKSVDGRYILLADNRIGFEVGAYDKTLPLIIDPVLSYSTYLGGSNDDEGCDITVDSTGNAYVTGWTNSYGFPTTVGAFDRVYGTIWNWNGYILYPPRDIFVTKLNAAGSAAVYSTYLGGSEDDWGCGIAVDAAGNAYVTGVTWSADFPTTPGAFQTSHGGYFDAFVTKLNAAGSDLVYSTYRGGSGDDSAARIAVDASGNAYVTSGTNSSDFPTTPGAFQTNLGGNSDAFVTKVNADGSDLVYSTYLGGSGNDVGTAIAVDSSGNAYVTGWTGSTDFPTANPFQGSLAGGTCGTAPDTYPCPDAFVAKLNAAGSALVYSTYLGGRGYAEGYGIAVDSTGNAYVTGFTDSIGFPTTMGAFDTTCGTDGYCNSDYFGNLYPDAFVTKLNAAGSALVYSTYLGGTADDYGTGIAVDSAGNAYVTGRTYYGDFPTTMGAFDTTCGTDGNCNPHGSMTIPDAFVTELNAAGSALVYSSYMGGSDYDYGTGIAVDPAGNAYVTGLTLSTDFPTTPGALQPSFGGDYWDAFVAKISPADVPGVSLTPARLTFASQPVGTTSSPQIVTLSNVGSAPLTIDSISASADFAQTNTCGADILGGSSCTIDVTFTPTGTGTMTGLITITDNATDSPHIVSLTVIGIQPSISISSVSPGSLTLVQGGSMQNVSVKLIRDSYTDGVSLSISTLPSGVSPNITQPAMGDSGSIGLQAGRYATLVSNQTITVTASGRGVSSVTATFNLTVNPPALPTVTSLSPSSATAGGAAFTLTVNGSNFVDNSVVRWNGSDRATTCLRGTQLIASITASDIASAGPVAVTVFTPTPGGGASNSVTFIINPPDNPVPTLASLAPSSATAGGSGFTLTVNGTNFVSGSVVRWGGVDRTTSFGSSTQLTASITAADIATAGTVAVTVFNPTPGGGTSSSLSFAINNRAPSLTSLSPSSATAGGAAFTLTLNGTNFINGSVVRWNGSDRTTTYVSSTQLTASIPASDIATGGTAQVTVFNPTPGGGSSSGVTFNILDFSLSKNPSSATVTAGQTAEYTLTVAPLGSFNQSVSLSCTGAPSAATCSVTPSSVTPDGTNNATATLRVTTTARSLGSPSVRVSPPGFGLRLPTLLLFMLITVTLLAIAAGHERARFRLIVALAALVLVSALVACGGGGGGAPPPPSQTGTPAGTYTLTVTATSGSLSHSTSLTLTVN
jgi:hypothetical protein